jgi:hypothetical protein
VVSPEGNDLPLRDSSCYYLCSSIHLTFLVLCSTFGLGSTRRRPTGTSLVRSTGWSMPRCRMDLPGPATSVGTRTDYSVGPWDYPAWATRHLKAWSTRTTQE